MNSSKTSVVFRLSYLLGSKESLLKDLYKSEYEVSNNLKYFENYRDARVLRILSMLRQSVFIDFIKYNKKQVKTIKNFKPISDSDMQFLKENKIDIEKAFKTLDLVKYLNFLTEMINIINYKVLVDLDIPIIEELSQYFYFPNFNFQSLKLFAEESYELNKANGLVFYNGKNIKNSLKYVLQNDKNCITSVYSLLNKRVEVKIEDYVFVFRKHKGEDLDENAKIHFEVLLEKNRKLGYVTHEDSDTPSKVQIAEDVAVENIIEEKAIETKPQVVETISGKEHILFVDCKTISMLKVLMFLNNREKDEYSKIVLLVYDELGVVWDIFVKLYCGSAKIEILNHCKGSVLKSSSDTFIAFYLGREIQGSNTLKVSVISENKNILYLLEKLGLKDINVYYMKDFSEAHSKYLNSKNIKAEKITSEACVGVEVYKNIIVKYGFLYSCYMTPMVEWGSKKYNDFVHDFVNVQIGLPIIFNEIEVLYEDVQKFLQVKRVESNFLISLNEVSLTFKIGGL